MGVDPKRQWHEQVRSALEKCDHDTSPDAFAALIAVMLYGKENPQDFLASLAGFTHDQEKLWIQAWAKGAMVPTPRMRQMIVFGVREHLSKFREGGHA
ncbi:MAG: hypothetical protein QY323_06105 [Patescibacteria group bacterium]|nr:MAG: hypothetical protein QY323_06105 [Patescibacteria group bacterium]